MKEKSASVQEAEAILRGKQEAAPEAMLKVAKRLKEENAFGLARMVLTYARKAVVEDGKLSLKLAQQHALCTYKDPDLPTDERLDLAEKILDKTDPLKTTTDQETLGLAGGIYKRKWQVDAQKRNLERSLAYYRRGYQEGAASDYGYTGINAAYVLDLLADQESDEAEKAGTTSDLAASRRAQARAIREDLIATLPPLMDLPGNEWLKQEWWFYATLAEACFGLGHYDDAKSWLKKRTELNVSDWEYASTAQQLAGLVSLQQDKSADSKGTPAWDVLQDFLDGNADAVQTLFAGKVGLALSGGGFRASLYHIGVLAKLAELDMLRHVEALSCVSGGSIIGAHYYLEVRKLLQEKADQEITHQDYIDLVKRVKRDFLAGVQRNVRVRVTAGLAANFKMLFSRTYARTERVGELYESEIYARIADGEGGTDRWLNGLFVQPKGTTSFNPKYDNWRRRNKVPTLILNATTINTGHNWQFTASWMGESPASIDTDIDGNYLLRRMYYGEAPPNHRKVRLGHAVGSSSCVPGLFPPLTLASLYPDKTVRLVDGGVHDNQGVVGLLEQDCTVLLVSDSSGQMGTVDEPGAGMLGVLLRTNSILMARVREAEYHDLKARRRSSLLRGFMFVHLKKDLDVEPVDWIGEKKLAPPPGQENPNPMTRYGIQKDVQERLAAIRTDLDSFCDAESFALMTSGYRMTEYEFQHGCIESFPLKTNTDPGWDFLTVEPVMQTDEGDAAGAKMRKLLTVASGGAFKIWKLSNVARILGIVVVLVFLGALGWGGWTWAAWLYATLGPLVPFLGPIIATVVFLATLVFVLLSVAWLVSHLHLLVFDRMFLNWGKVGNVVGA